MAVLKYRGSDGAIKTLGINSSGGTVVSGVSSVNGKTGAVTGLYDSDNPPPYPVSSVNGKTGSVSGLYDAENPPPYPVTSVNGKTGAITGVYDTSNPPPYPVTSVNGKTGAVTGVYAASNPPPYPVTSVNGMTGAVTGLYSQSNPPPYPSIIKLSPPEFADEDTPNVKVYFNDLMYHPHAKLFIMRYGCAAEEDCSFVIKNGENVVTMGVLDYDASQFSPFATGFVTIPCSFLENGFFSVEAASLKAGTVMYTRNSEWEAWVLE